MLIPVNGKVVSHHVLCDIAPPVRHEGLHVFLSVNRGSPDGKCILSPLVQAGV